MQWYAEEERYLKILYDICIQLSKEYMELYIITHKFQTKLRIPAIICSSLSGVASFGSSSFGDKIQRYISIGVGIVNVGIAIVQTYESYLKLGDIVSKSLSCSMAFKKLGESIFCETYIPVEDRNSTGITFLRDCFARYQTILDQAPPLEFHGKPYSDTLKKAQGIMDTISSEMRNRQHSPESSLRTSINILSTVAEEPVDAPAADNDQDVFRDMKAILKIPSNLPKGTPVVPSSRP